MANGNTPIVWPTYEHLNRYVEDFDELRSMLGETPVLARGGWAGGLTFQHPVKPEYVMHDPTYLIKGCQAKVYALAGTHSICQLGSQTFMKYVGMTMEERDPYVAEWANTIRAEEFPIATAPNS